MINSLVESLFVLLALIVAALWLRHRQVLREADGTMLSKVITDLLLPAMIFLGLSQYTITVKSLPLALIMLVTTLIMLGIAWQIGKWIGLQPTRLGSFTLVAGLGSSSTLGYALIAQVFPNNTNAAFDAIIISEIGVVLPLFIIGVPIAIYFGQVQASNAPKTGAAKRELHQFMRSPIFFSLISGLVVSFLTLPKGPVIEAFYHTLAVTGSALPVFVALSIGLMLRPVSIRSMWLPVLFVLILKLLVEPFIAAELIRSYGQSELARNVLTIEASMPSGTLSAIIATRYGCDSEFASAIIVVSYLASLLSVPLITALLK